MSEAIPFWTHDAPRMQLCSWSGDGAPVLLLHGMAAHSHWWDEVGPLLAQRTQPVALDLRGHGGSAWREDGVYDAARFAADVEEARHALGWERFALVGHSLGARVAAEYAATHPDRLTKLVLVDFLADGRGFGKVRPQPVYTDAEAPLSRFRLQPSGTLLGADALRALGEKSIKKAPDGRFTWKFDWRCFSYEFGPIWPTLERVKTPSLVIRGGESSLMDEATARRIADEMKGSLVTIPGAYHHVPLDKPQELADVLLGFL